MNKRKIFNKLVDFAALREGIILVPDEGPKYDDSDLKNIKYMPKAWHGWKKAWCNKFRDIDKIQDKMGEGGIKDTLIAYLEWMMCKLLWLAVAIAFTPITVLIWLICQFSLTFMYEKRKAKREGNMNKYKAYKLSVFVPLTCSIIFLIMMVREYHGATTLDTIDSKFTGACNAAADAINNSEFLGNGNNNERIVTEAVITEEVEDEFHENEIVDDNTTMNIVEADEVNDVDGDGEDDYGDDDLRVIEED